MAYQADERAYAHPQPQPHATPYYLGPRPGSSSTRGVPLGQQSDNSSPDRLHSSHSFQKAASATPVLPPTPYSHPADVGPSSAHSYSQPPMTPVSGPSYAPPSSVGYYSVDQTPHEPQAGLPSPSPGDDRAAVHFTPDGNPIVPVGISGGKMFQCRGYGACDKVFTRSEHLARHVRKHTGERPFPCHCGKAFSRLDNLRQHAATVHADANVLNDAMLMSLTPVHTALSTRASKEQRKRGEVVEVPKNAVERPRNTGRHTSVSVPDITVAAYPPYHPEPWEAQPEQPPPPASDTDQPPQPQYDYSYQSGSAPPDSNEAPRRPGSASSYVYPQPYYGEQRPPTSATSETGPLPPFYRSVSSGTAPQQYTESEPPTSAHGPPHSPMYPHPPPPANWSSPPPPGGYHESQGMYPPPPPESYGYTEPTPHAPGSHPPPQVYGPPPPGSAGYAYPPPATYYGPSQPYPASHAHPHHPPPSPYAPHPQYAHQPPPPPSHFPYHPPPPPHAHHPHGPPQYYTPSEFAYPAPPSHDRKRRSDPAEDEAARKHARSSHGSAHRYDEGEGSSEFAPPALHVTDAGHGDAGNGPSAGVHSNHTNGGNSNSNEEPLWLPPTTERRSSLAISALLGSPQQDHRRPLPLTSGPAENGSHGANGSGSGAGKEGGRGKEEGGAS